MCQKRENTEVSANRSTAMEQIPFQKRVSLKNQRSRGNFLLKNASLPDAEIKSEGYGRIRMTKYIRILAVIYALILMCAIISCNKDNNKNKNILDKNVEGSKLTEEYCINLVRNHWDCNKGAHYFQQNHHTVLPQAHYIEFSCYQGDEGKIINVINKMFDDPDGGILDVGKSYYKNYILCLYLYYEREYPYIYKTLTVNF